MEFRYYVDPETGLPHIYGHGVTEAEVEHAVRHAQEDRQGFEGSRNALGQSAAGRYPRVIYVPDDTPQSIFVISAYELRGKPLQALRRRRRRKGR
jgi:hypothetical protein